MTQHTQMIEINQNAIVDKDWNAFPSVQEHEQLQKEIKD